MSTMTISPIQSITRAEFEEQTNYIHDGFEQTFKQIDAVEGKIDDLKVTMNRRFDGVDKRFNSIDERFNSIHKKFEEQKSYMDDGFKKSFETSEAIEKKLDTFSGDMNRKVDSLTKAVEKITKALKV